jgi:beta-xylosidase
VDQDVKGVGRPVPSFQKPNAGNGSGIIIPQTTDEFDGPRLGLQWQWHSNHDDAWYSLTKCPGYLRLYPQTIDKGDFGTSGNLLLQKFPAREFSVETELELPPRCGHLRAGLIVTGDEYCALDFQPDATGYRIRLLKNGQSLADLSCDISTIRLRVTVREGGLCRFGVIHQDGNFHVMGPVFQARAGRWIGAKVGIYCVSSGPSRPAGHADFAHFRLGGSV